MMSGMKKKMAMRTRSMRKKGMMPRKTVSDRMPVVPATTKALMPTGGVTMPISMNFTIRMPSQMGSNPNSRATGSSRGTEMTSRDRDSRTMPSGTRHSSRMSMTRVGDMFQPRTAMVTMLRTRAATKKAVRMTTTITMHTTMAVVDAVDCRAPVMPCQIPLAPSLRSSMSKMTTAAMAPNAADSVAVKILEYMPP